MDVSRTAWDKKVPRKQQVAGATWDKKVTGEEQGVGILPGLPQGATDPDLVGFPVENTLLHHYNDSIKT